MTMGDTGQSFERQFDALVPGCTLISNRTEKFDAHHALFYSPLQYESQSAPELITATPDEAWVLGAFKGFVRDEFGARQEAVVVPVAGAGGGVEVDLLDFATELRDRLERSLVYQGALETILERIPSFDIAERLHAIICDEAFGAERNGIFVPIDEFRGLLRNVKVGLRLVLLGLPFRDQNALRTDNNPEDATLAEAFFLIRLHCTALALYQVLPTGADVLVLSDGALYAPIFGVSEISAQRYLHNVRKLRDALNLRGTVSIVDLRQLISLYDRHSGVFEACINRVKDVLLSYRNSGDISGSFDVLESGMRWNYNSRQFGVGHATVAQWLRSGDAPDANERDRSRLPTREGMTNVAALYAATNLALRWHDVVARMLPTAVRATMHPKKSQIGLPRFGSCFPWNGVAVLNRAKMDVEIHSLAEAARRGMQVVPYYDHSHRPIFYERSGE